MNNLGPRVDAQVFAGHQSVQKSTITPLLHFLPFPPEFSRWRRAVVQTNQDPEVLIGEIIGKFGLR